jgi:GT2 family glycosyltransferase
LSSISTSPRTSVVVITHNEGDRLRRTVDELATTLPDEAEIVVVDDHSTDGSADLPLADERLRVVRPPTRFGIARSRNYGAAHARGEVLVFTDAHMSFDPGWLAPIRDALESPDVGAASLPVAAIDDSRCKGYGIRWKDDLMNVEWLPCPGDAPTAVPMLCGCFIAMRRDVFAECGGFDGGLVRWGYEDAELSLRLWTSGYECVVVPGAEVRHLFRSRFPYELEPWLLVHNRLRVGIVHFTEHRLARLVARLQGSEAFASGLARVFDSDVWSWRERVRSSRRFDDSWFFDRFGIKAFDS